MNIHEYQAKELLAKFGVELYQSPRNPEPHRTRLTVHAAASDGREDVELVGHLRQRQRPARHLERFDDGQDGEFEVITGSFDPTGARFLDLVERIASHCDGSSVRDCYVIRALGHHELCEGEH